MGRLSDALRDPALDVSAGPADRAPVIRCGSLVFASQGLGEPPLVQLEFSLDRAFLQTYLLSAAGAAAPELPRVSAGLRVAQLSLAL
jgi:hypothetical protein